MDDGDEIELSVDPRDDLPDELVRELEFAAFSPETSGEGSLVGLLAEAVHPILYGAEQSELRTRVVEALSQPGLAVEPALAARVLGLLDRWVFDAEGDRVFAIRANALYEMLLNWDKYFNDHEKLVGHLLLCHGTIVEPTAPFAQALNAHAEAHR